MNPILSIVAAVLITILFIISCAALGIYLPNFDFIIFFVIFLCGGVATWFSTENKVRYSLYYGVIIFVYLLMGLGSFTDLGKIIFSILFLIPALFGGYVAKNEKDGLKNFVDNKFQFGYKVFLLSLFKRNRIFLIASMVVFLVSFFAGAISPFLTGAFNHYMINLWADYVSGNSIVGFSTISIFLLNGRVALYNFYFGGIFLGILSTMHLVSYGLVEGFALVKYPIYILYGIFRDLGFIIATAAGFKLLSTTINIIKNMLHIERNKSKIMQISQILDANYSKFRDSIILFSISVILLFVAAIIAANITIPL